MIRVFIVDDHPILLRVVRGTLEAAEDLEVCGEASTGETALEGISAATPDVALIDVSLPGMTGFDLVRLLRMRRPELRCLVLSGHQDPSYVDLALEGGARGYLLKGGSAAELIEAVRTVHSGGLYVARSLRDTDSFEPDGPWD